MDRPGLSAKHLLDVSSLIRNICRKKDIQLAGFDIMEFNMHFLGIETEDGLKDSTLSLVGDFISALLPGS
jgi:hypothetical protein